MKANYKLQTGGGLIEGIEATEIVTRYEQIPTTVLGSADEGFDYIADQVAEAINKSSSSSKPFVLGLSTGKSPIGIYERLVELCNEGKVSFKNVVVFSLDEYYPVNEDSPITRGRDMNNMLLSHIDIPAENIHTIKGDIPKENITEYCRDYEAKIASYGGIDLMLLGVGPEGQIGFNDPGTYHNTKTRFVAISNKASKMLASTFYGLENVPKRAITMGISTVMSAKKVVCFAWSEEKSATMATVIEGKIDPSIPATILQQHPNCEIVISEDVAALLTRFNTPWMVGTCEWTDKFIRKAVLWLCDKTKKPILKLTYQDYIDNSLGQLIDNFGDYSSVNIKVFNDLQHTISGWPGGKPDVDDSTRPERSTPFPKRIVIFSPHPDDDVISMGGTFIRLVEQGHDVHVAYQTSGNIAVHDDVVLQILDSARECGLEDKYDQVRSVIEDKKKGDKEPELLRQYKGSIRRAEAKAACRSIGLNDKTNAHFLNLPFYETGSVKKSGIGQDDIDIIVKLLRDLKPHQIYAAGDLTDPHGTHRVCIEAVLGAIEHIKDDEWLKDCRLWLYRGAWQEWDLDMVDMAVPLSPGEVVKKRHAIYRHLSQKDIVPFPGEDKREFWQRAEDRTQATAQHYDNLGMAEYEAIEVFVRYHF